MNGVTGKEKLEVARNILNNAAEINLSKKLLLKISQKTDEYLVKYIVEMQKQQRNVGLK